METTEAIVISYHSIRSVVAITPITPGSFVLVRDSILVEINTPTSFITVIYTVSVTIDVTITINLPASPLLLNSTLTLPAPVLSISATESANA